MRATSPSFALLVALLISNSQAIKRAADRHATARWAATPRSNARSDSATELELLWSGLDVEDGSRMPISLASRTVFNEVHLLGPPDSGTNLMVKMFQLNWPDRVPIGPGALDQIVWKHSLSNATNIKHLFSQHLDPSRVTLIIQIRSPIAQLDSWNEAPYSLEPCFHREVSDWTEPCFANTKPFHHDTTVGVSTLLQDGNSNHFTSSMDVYNRYLEQYLRIDSLGGFKNVIISPMEDVVLSPKLVFEEIAGKLGWPVPEGGIRIYGDTANREAGGMNEGRDRALEKLVRRPWLADFKTFLPLLCQGIDQKPLMRFLEGTYTANAKNYTYDCMSLE